MTGDMGFREAVTQSLRLGGVQLLSQPSRFLSFLIDLIDRDSPEAKVVSYQMNDELLAPLEQAVQDPSRESLQRARAIVRNTLYRERMIDAELSGIVADGLAGGLADFLGIAITPREGDAGTRAVADGAGTHEPKPTYEDVTSRAPQPPPTSGSERTTRVVSPPPDSEQPLQDAAPNTSTATTSATPTAKGKTGLIIALVSVAVVAIAIVAIVVVGKKPAAHYESEDIQVAPVSGDAQAAEDAEAEDAQDYGKGYVFTQLIDPYYEPYEYYDDSGMLTGFDVELARAVCDYYGWKFSESTMSFDAALGKLRQGEGSCAWCGITKTPEREEYFLFSKPYVESHFTYDGEESVSEYAVAFRKEDKKLCELVNAAFDALSADGTVQKLADKYLKNTNDVLLL